MTELSFLIELLLEHELAKETKTLIKERIREIESTPRALMIPPSQGSMFPVVRDPAAQAPSILAKYPDLATHPPGGVIKPEEIAKTPEAAKALADRERLRAQALSGKREEGQTAPRKLGRQ